MKKIVTYAATALLTIVAAPQAAFAQSLGDALNNTNLTWTTGVAADSDVSWFAQDTVTHDGAGAAQSGAVAYGQSSTLQTTVTGPGTLTFWWKVSSNWYNRLDFRIDNGWGGQIYDEEDWVQVTSSISAGTHTLRWIYTKNNASTAGADAGWVAQVTWVPVGEAKAIRVATTGSDSNDGSTWAKAKRTVGAALAAAGEWDEVWIAKGTYKEGSPIEMVALVGIYGGFAGTETSRSQRVPGKNETILDGNNAHRVVTATSVGYLALLDTVTVTNGYDASTDGAGMYCEASPTISNCTFTANKGDGIYLGPGSSPTITNCTFTGHNGYAVYHVGGTTSGYITNSTITNCTFSGNGTGVHYSWHTSGKLVNCTISGNTTGVSTFNTGIYGGGLNSNVSIYNCIVWGNTIYSINEGIYINVDVDHSIVRGGSTTGGNKDADPLLKPLGNYGGSVQTMPVKKGSPAIDAGLTQDILGEYTTIPTTDAIGQPRDTSKPCTIGAVEYFDAPPPPAATLELDRDSATAQPGGSAFNATVTSNVAWTASTDATWLSVAPASGNNNGRLAITASPNATGAPRTATLTVEGSGITRTIAVAQAAFKPAPVGSATYDVYETKATVRTSVVKEMKVKVAGGATATVHYRAPVSKSYSIYMAIEKLDDERLDGYTAKGHGRMWTAGSGTAATLDTEKLAMRGCNAEGGLCTIGAKGQHIPVAFEYYAEGAAEPLLRFTGLATVDWKNERFSGSAGTVRGEGIAPLPCAAKGCATPNANQGAGLAGTELADVYYPRPCNVSASGTEPAPAHFIGTYTTRYNAALSKGTGMGGTDFAVKATNAVRNKVPSPQR